MKLKEEIGSLKEKVGGLEEENGGLKEKNDDLASTVAVLRKRIAELEGGNKN